MKFYLKIAAVSFLALAVITILQQARRFLYPDFLATQFLQTVIDRRFDIPLSIFSLLGSAELTSTVLLAIGLVMLVKLHRLPILIFLGFAALHLVELAGKLFIFHPGPPKFFFRYSLPFFFPSSYVQTGYSFPSGHVARTMFLVCIGAFLVAKFVKTRSTRMLWWTVLGLLTLIMIVSRVYLGEHWFSDVLGGAFLGAFLSTLALAFW